MPEATRPTTITCARCGTEKTVGKRGPIPVYCSDICRAALKHERSKQDGRYERALAEAREQAARRQADNTRPCPHCGTAMTNPRRVQCGAPECKRLYQNERQRAFQGKHKAEHGVHYSRQYDQPRTKEYQVTCIWCGKEATVTKTSAKYCSRSCWYEAKRRPKRYELELYRPKRRTLRVQVIHVVRCTRRRWYSTRCPICAEWFLTGNSGHKTCSRQCSRRAAKDRRRALERDAFVAHVNRLQVYERDQWNCQLCGEAVLRDEVVPHPQAPTLDHIVALSQGGTHEPANAQLAHFYCNTIKNDGEWQETGRPPAPWE